MIPIASFPSSTRSFACRSSRGSPSITSGASARPGQADSFPGCRREGAPFSGKRRRRAGGRRRGGGGGGGRGGGRRGGVLGCGIDVASPPEHAELREEILEKGAIFSEYPPGSPPLPHRFPVRNRIVSGLWRGAVGARPPERSGALIPARLALEQGRGVMVVPGNPWFAHTAGSNRLLREGATPVCSAADGHGGLGRPASAAGGRV